MQNKNSILTIFNINGSVVYNSKLAKKGLKTHNIDSENLKKGTYIISLNSNGKIFNKRLIVN